jgi:hypothetical protein
MPYSQTIPTNLCEQNTPQNGHPPAPCLYGLFGLFDIFRIYLQLF